MTLCVYPYQQNDEKHNLFVTPAQAGVQKSQEILDSRLRGNDSKDGEDGFFSNRLMVTELPPLLSPVSMLELCPIPRCCVAIEGLKRQDIFSG